MKRKILKTTLLTALPALTLASSCVMLISCKNNDMWQGRDAYILDENNNKIWFKDLTNSNICLPHNNNDSQEDIISDDGTRYTRETFNSTIYLNPTLSKIPTCFLRNCTAFNKVIHIPDSVTTISGEFLAGCTSFNSPIGFSRSLKIIANHFMYGCSEFNTNIDLPSSLEHVDHTFMYGNNKMQSTINVHHIDIKNVFVQSDQSFAMSAKPTTPITIKTFSAEISAAFQEWFPNSLDSNPFRDLAFDPDPTQK